MIDPQELYHWLGQDSYEAILETYECLPEECLTYPVVEEEQDYE